MTDCGEDERGDEEIGGANRDRGCAMYVAIRSGNQERQRDPEANEGEAVDEDGCAMTNLRSHGQAGLTSDVHEGHRVAFSAIFE